MVQGIVRRILLQVGSRFIAYELSSRAPDLLVSFFECCIRDIVWGQFVLGSVWSSLVHLTLLFSQGGDIRFITEIGLYAETFCEQGSPLRYAIGADAPER